MEYSKIGPDEMVSYEVARLIRILVIFEPLDIASFDTNMAKTAGSSGDFETRKTRYSTDDYFMRYELWKIENFVNFWRGLTEGSRLFKDDKMQNCEDVIDYHYVLNFYSIANSTVSQDLFSIMETVIDIIYHTHDLAYECYEGTLEAKEEFLAKKDVYTDPKNLLNNIVFNFGNIFDAIRDALVWFDVGSQGEDEVSYDIGYALGNSFYLVLLDKK